MISSLKKKSMIVGSYLILSYTVYSVIFIMVTTTKYFCEIRCLNQNTVINKITCVLKTQNKTLTLHYYTLFTSGGGEANLNSVIHTGQVTSSSQSWHVGIDNHSRLHLHLQATSRKEAGVPGENPGKHRKNMQTLHGKALPQPDL